MTIMKCKPKTDQLEAIKRNPFYCEIANFIPVYI